MRQGEIILASQIEPDPSRRTTTEAEGWVIGECEVAASTNLLAATLPPWHAVRADTQTAGRGRFQRSWVSDQGGLWLSAVLPTPPDSGANWGLLPLAAGAAVCEALKALGVPELRMRWPNDVLVGDRKVCGLLLDQFAPGRTVVGIGINVRNRPELSDPEIANRVARLADLISPTPELPELAKSVLRQLRSMWDAFVNAGLANLSRQINSLWDGAREVELELDGGRIPIPASPALPSESQVVHGRFLGVDDLGRLRLAGTRDTELRFEPHQVRHLKEIKT